MPTPSVVALKSEVLLRERFQEPGSPSLFRIDYLQAGALLGSRFTLVEDDDA